MVLRTAKGDLRADPLTVSRRLPPNPRVSMDTPGRAFIADETSALPNPLVKTESDTHRVAVICSGAKSGLKAEMAAESNFTQFHNRVSAEAVLSAPNDVGGAARVRVARQARNRIMI